MGKKKDKKKKKAIEDIDLLWARIGEIRAKQIEDINADERTQDRRQGWVAGMLQSIQILRTGVIADVSEEMWAEAADRFPFPPQSGDYGTLKDYRDVIVSKEERQQVAGADDQQTFQRTLSPVEVLADPSLAGFVHVEVVDEEPDALVNEDVMKAALDQLS